MAFVLGLVVCWGNCLRASTSSARMLLPSNPDVEVNLYTTEIHSLDFVVYQVCLCSSGADAIRHPHGRGMGTDEMSSKF